MSWLWSYSIVPSVCPSICLSLAHFELVTVCVTGDVLISVLAFFKPSDCWVQFKGSHYTIFYPLLSCFCVHVNETWITKNIWGPPSWREILIFVWKNEKCVELNFCPPTRHVRWKKSAGVDGGLSGGSIVRRPGSEDPHRHQRNYPKYFQRPMTNLISVWPLCTYRNP